MSVPHIDPAQAIQKMDAGEALVVDVRQPDEHELQRIPGSLLLPLDDINAESAARVLPDKNALTYVYCRSGVRSTAACEKLEALGYTNLYNLGGLTVETARLFLFVSFIKKGRFTAKYPRVRRSSPGTPPCPPWAPHRACSRRCAGPSQSGG